MKFAARAVAIMVVGSFLFPSGFAEDAAKTSNDSTKHEASESNASVRATAALETGIPAAPQSKKASASSSGEETPKGEVFAGYSFIRFNVDSHVLQHNFNAHGGTASIAGNVNNWFGLVGDFGFYRFSDHPAGTSAHMSTYLFGPRFSHRGERWTPFMHTLFGAARIVEGPNAGIFGPNPGSVATNAFAAAFGGGVDLKLTKHVAWRLVQSEFLVTKFADGADSTQSNFRAASGIVFRFGGGTPPPLPPAPNHAPTATCSANPSKVYAGSGDSIIVQAQASDPDNDSLSYAWTATGGSVNGNGSEVRWNAGNAAPGTYTVTAHVDDGHGGSVNCSTDVHLEPRPNRPPTIKCAASPTTVEVGQQSNISSTASDPDSDPLTYSYTASGGRIVGSGANVQLDTTGVAAPSAYTVNCSVDDGRGGIASDSTTINVRAIPKNLFLHSIYFQTARPTVKNPTGGLLASQEKTLITLASDFKEYLTYKADARLNLQGHADHRGGKEYNQGLTDRRVERTKSFLVEQGVPADKLDTQGMGEEPPPDKAAEARIKDAVEREQDLSQAQKNVLTRNSLALALAQSRRVDVTLEGTSDTSSRQYPFAAGDALNLIDPRGVETRREEQRQKAKKPAAKKPTTRKKPATTKKATTTKKAAPKKK